MSKRVSTNPVPYVIAACVVTIFACSLIKERNAKPEPAPIAAAPPLSHQPDAGVVAALTPEDDFVPEEDPMPPEEIAIPQRVVLIGVDGMHVKLVDEMPTVKQMFADGSGTLKALVPKGATTTVSFGALLSGADPATSGFAHEPEEKGAHGLNFEWKEPVKVKATLFTAVETSGRKVLAVVQKGKIRAALRPDKSLDDIVTDGNAKRFVKYACDAMQDDAIGFVFLHFKMIDDAGHRDGKGWLSRPQIEEAKGIDDQIAKIQACVDASNAEGRVATTIIVTADHGGTPGLRSNGKPRGHGANDDNNRLVPWVIVGPGIQAGHTIVGREDLVLSRSKNAVPSVVPTKEGTQPALLLYDTVPTILRILGMETSSIPTLSPYAKSVDEVFLSP